MTPKYLNLLLRGISALILPVFLIGFLIGGAFPVDAAPGDITRISVDSAGAQANGTSFGGSISNDGRFVAFRSDANNLVAGDANGAEDIFVRDRQMGTTTLVSVATSGEQANYTSSSPRISGDGRYVVFDSQASNLISDDTNHYAWDVFVHDRQTGETTCLSVNSSGEQGNSGSFNGSISSDGRYATFESSATNLVSDDTNGKSDVFLHDRQTGETTRISINSSGGQANDSSYMAGISADGRFVSFESSATNLVSGDTNGAMDIFLRDRQTGETKRVSVASNGVQSDDGSFVPGISGNGRYVVFESGATNLVSGDTYGMTHIYVHDRLTAETTRASVNSDGSQMIGRLSDSAISDDGRFVAFDYADTDNYGSALFEIYVHDRQTGSTTHASANLSGGHGSSDQDSSYAAGFSAGGRFVVFTSLASNLISGDTNGAADIFVKEMAYPPDLSPTVSSIHLQCGGTACSYPSGLSVTFSVTFSEVVTGVTADDFALTITGGISGASVTGLSGSGNEYIVAVNTGAGDGTLRLEAIDDDSIKDIALNPLGGSGAGNGNFITGDIYVVDKNFPTVIGSARVDQNPVVGGNVNFAVTFSEEVSGVDAGDFVLTTSGNVASAIVSEVAGSGKSYNVRVNTGTGEGTLRLDLIDDDSIRDVVSTPIGGSGAGNGNFTAGEAYAIEKFPVVVSSLRNDPSPSSADVIHFRVAFSKTVTGVDTGDFVLTTTGGISGVAITAVDIPAGGAGDVYLVAVNTGNDEGTLRLDVFDNDSILDTNSQPLGGAGVGNGNFATGEEYSIKRTPINLLSESIRSNGKNDGWVLETSEASEQGGSKNTNAPAFLIGDDAQNRQYRAILHFPTYLPDNAVVTRAILAIKNQGVVGVNPFTDHQNINIDIRSGYFGSSGFFGINSLDLMDFQAPASKNSVGMIINNPVNGWYWALLDNSASQFINLQGVTQLRLMFQLDDDGDLSDDYLAFFSGNYDELADRPHLIIEYYTPR